MADAEITTTSIAGRYEVLDVLGKGAFGETLLARETATDRRVAIKTLHAARAGDLKAFELFEREATVLRTLRHPGVPEIFDSFHADWQGDPSAFLVMEYVEGPTLQHLITEGHGFSPEDVLDLVLELAGILEYLHERVPPILHRDIKPSNIILRDGRRPVLVDFGAVRNVFRSPEESGSTVVGTYGYMPYEQYMGQATPASDLYALGATLLHLLTGRPPSDFLTDAGRLGVPDNVPGGERIRSILNRLLAPGPGDRFPSATAVRRALLQEPVPSPRSAAGAALAARTGLALQTAERAAAALATLPPPTRALTGPTGEWYRKVAPVAAYYALQGKDSVGAWLVYLIGCVVSVGVLPLVLLGMSQARRMRVKPFFREGQPAVGHVQSITPGDSYTKVRYEFPADGQVHRGADSVIPKLAERWREGDAIAVLYLADRDYDSVIVSTS